MKKYKNYLFVLTSILLLVLAPSVLALELKYPPLFGLEPTGATALPKFILYIFYFLLLSAGGMGILSIVIGGFQILLNFGRPEAVSAARKRIFDAVMGIVLLVTSVVLLNTINPQLIEISSPKTTLSYGTYIVTDTPKTETNLEGRSYKSLPGTGIADTSPLNLLNPTFVYNCQSPGPTILLRQFGQINFRRGPVGTNFTKEIKCNVETIILGKSVQWIKKDTGVYFYNTNDCTGISTCEPNRTTCVKKSDGLIPSFDDLRDPDQVVRSIQIVSGSAQNEKFGIYMAKAAGFTSECIGPFMNLDETTERSGCTRKEEDDGKKSPSTICCTLPDNRSPATGPFNPKWAYIIKPNPFLETSGDGVLLYSTNLAVFIDKDEIQAGLSICQGCFYDVHPDDFIWRRYFSFPEDPYEGYGWIYTNKTHEDIEDLEECQLADPEAPCLREVSPLGSYYIVLHGEDKIGDELGQKRRTCKLFRGGASDIKNIGQLDFLPENYDLYRIDIIPTSSTNIIVE